MKKTLLSLLTLTTLLSAQCYYNATDVEVDWKAYKTPAKIGVKGTFDTIKLLAPQQTTQMGLLENASLKLDTHSINSKNSARDAKLVKFFFQVQNVNTIDAKIISVSKKEALVAITMNGITKNIPMKLDFDKDEIEAEGTIDLGDFAMLPSLHSINKACFDLHKGKTWQDVSIEFEIKTHRNCE
jgi:polyisoprenoid-binding protein YceI